MAIPASKNKRSGNWVHKQNYTVSLVMKLKNSLLEEIPACARHLLTLNGHKVYKVTSSSMITPFPYVSLPSCRSNLMWQYLGLEETLCGFAWGQELLHSPFFPQCSLLVYNAVYIFLALSMMYYSRFFIPFFTLNNWNFFLIFKCKAALAF